MKNMVLLGQFVLHLYLKSITNYSTSKISIFVPNQIESTIVTVFHKIIPKAFLSDKATTNKIV